MVDREVDNCRPDQNVRRNLKLRRFGKCYVGRLHIHTSIFGRSHLADLKTVNR
jgi:hypothetical protein